MKSTGNIAYDELLKFMTNDKDMSLVYPKNIDSILDEANSNWNFSVKLNNTSNGTKEVALFTGGIDVARYALLDANRDTPAIGGGKIDFTIPFFGGIDLFPAGMTLRVEDYPNVFNLNSGITVDAIATQRLAALSGNVIQKIWVDIDNKFVSVQTPNSNIPYDFYRDFIVQNPCRIYELQVTSDKPELAFLGKLKIKQLNPFESAAVRTINFEDYYKPENSVGTKIIIPFVEYVGNNTVMSVSVPGVSSLSINFKLSALTSDLEAIKNKLKAENLLKALGKKINENN